MVTGSAAPMTAGARAFWEELEPVLMQVDDAAPSAAAFPGGPTSTPETGGGGLFQGVDPANYTLREAALADARGDVLVHADFVAAG